MSEIDVDHRVFGFTLLTSLLTGLLFGLVPAVKASRVEMTQALKEGARTESKNFKRFGLQSFLVIAEFALALMLLVGAGLLLNSFVRLLRVDLGFNPENVLTFNVSLPITSRHQGQAASFYAQALQRVDALPGVDGAAIINTLPLGHGVMQVAFQVEGQPASDAPTIVTQPLISSDYFQVMSIPLLKGRYFSERDTPESVGVVNINDTFARRFFSGEDPVGKRLSLYQDSQGKPIWLEIVGIVGDVRQDALSARPEPALYVPYTQVSDPGMLSGMTFVVRTTVPSAAFATAVQREIQAVNRDIPVTDMKTMREIVTASVADERFITLLLGTFALLAIVLASVGIYGVVTYMVAQRTHEIGIRMALGAQPRNVLKLVIGQGMMRAFVGVAIGNVCALWLTRMLSGMLYNVSPTDPLTFTCLSILLVALALVASYLPARRATRIDPVVALRDE
ncbi:MAG: FtsX-like permease family protein [Pyrinomonadaceae bacterium]